MNPDKYLTRWVPVFYGISPDERGFRKICIHEIHRLTGISKNTINTWGAMFEHCPDHVRYTLKWVNDLNQIRELVTLELNLSEG